MLRFALAICVVLAINCGDNRDGHEPCSTACPAAPNAKCEGATTLVEYGESTCDDDVGTCSYAETRTNCADSFQVCASGKCVAPDDPCAGTQCTAAPAATCTGTVLHAFDPNGACDSSTGDCSYTPHAVDCAITHQICNNGACVDPCGAVTCDSPPDATCTGTMSTTYAATGTCDSSSGTPTCHYAPTTVNCATGNGTCNAATGLCTTPCTGVSCTTPPAASCAGTMSTTYGATGTCDGTSGTAECEYTPTTVNCASTNKICDGATGACVDPCTGVACTTPPAASCTGTTSTTYAPAGTCDGTSGSPVCSYAPIAVDCAVTGQTCEGATGLCASVCVGVSCSTPPPPQCSGTTSISFGAAGTCDGTSGSPVCGYPQTPTDCTLANQTCDPGTGLCADPCTLTSCITPPPASCAANQLTTFGSPGTCGATSGVPTCSYAPTTIDCGAGFCDPNTAACLADCGGSDCQTPPAATCSSDNTLTTYVTPGTCNTTGAPTCQFTTAATDCSLTGQTCSAGACGGSVQVRVQGPATITDLAGTSQTVIGRIFITGVTDVTAGNDALGVLDLVELGVGTGADPALYVYQLAAPNAAYPGDEPGWDEYTATFTIAGAAGATQHYAYRLTRNGGATWIYGDLGTAGSSDGFTTPGTLQIAAPFFSEYVEGGGNNKAVEIYNPGSVAFSLNGCVIRQFTNAATTPTTVLTFTATDSVAAHGVVTFCQTAITGVTCTKTTGSTGLWNGNDTVELFCSGALLDAIGKESENPAFWGTEPTTTINHTLLRHCDVVSGDTVATDAFDPAVQWKAYPQDTFTDLGLRTCPLP